MIYENLSIIVSILRPKVSNSPPLVCRYSLLRQSKRGSTRRIRHRWCSFFRRRNDPHHLRGNDSRRTQRRKHPPAAHSHSDPALQRSCDSLVTQQLREHYNAQESSVSARFNASTFQYVCRIKCPHWSVTCVWFRTGLYSVYAEDFMVRDVKYVYHRMTYGKLMDVLKENREIRCFPLVDNPESMILLGSIQRMQLINLVEKHIGTERRRKVGTDRKELNGRN